MARDLPSNLGVKDFINSLKEGLLVTDNDLHIIQVNPRFSLITGYDSDEVIGKKPNILKSGRHDTKFYEEMWEAILRNDEWHGEIWNRRKNGEVYPEWLSISVIKNRAGKITNYVGTFTDISLRKISEESLAYLAYHDPLTGVPNRMLFMDRMNQAFAYAKRKNLQVGVVFIDLDGFKPVNDLLGHTQGDKLLSMVSERLCDCIRESDTIGRWGGDEFVLLLAGIPGPKHAVSVAEKVLAVLRRPFMVDHVTCRISASIGIGIYPDNGLDPELVLRKADQAMYRAKEKGKNQTYLCNCDRDQGFMINMI